MPVFQGNKVLQTLRMNNNISQEKLCYGICDKGTLSRIERGQTSPSAYISKALFERLGYDMSKFIFIIENKKEAAFRNAVHKIEGLIVNNEIEEAEKELNKLESENKASSQSRINNIQLQILMRIRISILHKKKESIELIQKETRSAIELTIPNFDENNINKYLLTYDEISLITSFAANYYREGIIDRAVKILYAIKDNMDNYYIDDYEKSRGYILTLFNLSNLLIDCEQYNKVIDICDAALECCRLNQRLSLYPHIAVNKAFALFKLGKDEREYKALFINSIYALKLYEDKVSLSKLQAFIEAENIMEWKFD